MTTPDGQFAADPPNGGDGERPGIPPDPSILAGLTDAQKEAVQHRDGPILVLAAAGSGKTLTITRRMAALLASGVPPWSILALTFTNKAAGEMRERIERLIPPEQGVRRGLTVSTFHSFCARLMRRYAEFVGLNSDYTIYDMSDQKSTMKEVLKRLDLSTSNFPPDMVLSVISQQKNELVTPSEYAKNTGDFYSRNIARCYERYEKMLRDQNAVDFDDLLLYVAKMLRDVPEVREELQQRYRYVLIDEYQDTNHAQFVIAHTLASAHRNLCVVGDPDQCLPPGTLVLTPSGFRPIESIHEGEDVTAGTGWGKTSGFPVEKVMVNHHCGHLVSIETEDGSCVRGTPNHLGFARIEANKGVHYTYLMWKRGMGYRLGTTRGVRASKDGKIVSGLQVRTNQEVADAIWIVHSGTSSAEAQYHENLYSVRYGIPTLVFFTRGRRMDLEQSHIDRLYQAIDTQAGADRLMADLHLDRRYPHHRPGAVTRGDLARRHVLMTMFGGPRTVRDELWHEHRVQLITSGGDLREEAVSRGFRVRPGNRGTWRIETSRKHSDDAAVLADQILDLHEEMELIPRARLTPEKAFQFMPFSHIHPGMIVPTCKDGTVRESRVTRVTWEDYDGPVYDLSVPEVRNFVSGGLVVHNSIYGWRGADISNILEFQEQYPDAKVVKLGENFRSTAPILAIADGLIKHNRQRHDKPLFTQKEGGENPRIVRAANEHHESLIVAEFFEKLGRDPDKEMVWKDMAVLYRTNALSRVIEGTLRKRGLPYVIVRGTAFYDRKEIKDALAYLRVVLNPYDEVSLKRIINNPPRGIGNTTIKRVQFFAMNNDMTLLEALYHLNEVPDLSPRAINALERFLALINHWRGGGAFMGQEVTGELAELVEKIIDESGLVAHFRKSKAEEDAERIENLNELITAAREFEEDYETARAAGSDPLADPFGFEPTGATTGESTEEEPSLMAKLRAYLENVALVSDVDAFDPEAGAITLMTLHAAKGLEFGAVAIIGMEESILPHSRSIDSDTQLEEERRLCFVGITRAKEHLLMTCTFERTLRGMTMPSVLSRFLTELPDEHVDWVGQRRPVDDFDRFNAESEPTIGGGSSSSATGSRAPAPAAGGEFPVGTLVMHPQFGMGRVEKIGRAGKHERLHIRFQAVGPKTLIAEFARLERCE